MIRNFGMGKGTSYRQSGAAAPQPVTGALPQVAPETIQQKKHVMDPAS